MNNDKPANAPKNATAILDNQRQKMADYLRSHLSHAEVFRLVSAYFSIYGFETLAQELESPALQTKFLFGDPDSVSDIATGSKKRRGFNFTEDGLSPDDNNVPQQSAIARRCSEWVSNKKVEIKTISQTNFLHGKMYHITDSQGDDAATVGSSNFTRRGLGVSQNANLEINIAISEQTARAELKQWFDTLWNNDKLTKNAKQDVLDSLKRLHKENSPEFIYYKTLYELFRDKIESHMADAQQVNASLQESQVWDALYEFQKDGATSAINRLQRHNGCILADSVGLGKTYTALAVIKHFQQKKYRVLVLCPKKLENNWKLYLQSAYDSGNPFPDDMFSYALLAHTDLTRDSGNSGSGINLATLDWKQFNLIVIDESHNFRNEGKNPKDADGNIIRHSRYYKLIHDIIGKGGGTKVLMLSATPVNNSLTDLRNQIYLITEGRDDFFAETLGIRNIKQTLKAAQDKFLTWSSSKTPDKDALMNTLNGDFFQLLSGITIARSRKQIRKFYADFIKEQGDFPTRNKPINKYPHTDTKEELSYEKLHQDIDELKFFIYCPTKYITDEDVKKRLADDKKQYNFNQATREGFLIGMMHTNFLKRLESSAQSLSLTLQRTIDKMDTQLGKIDKYLQTPAADAQIDITPDEDEEDEDFVVNRNATTSYNLRELNVIQWKKDIAADKNTMQQILNEVNKITPQRDNKLNILKDALREKSNQKNRKLLIFTAFKDTAVYLYEQTEQLAKELNLKTALVCGDGSRSEHCANDFDEILNHFAPLGRKKNTPNSEQIDIIIATDCISEGQNLQDCDTVLNYDIHWNPVRLIQRFGRIDRIGSRNDSISMINYWPTKNMDLYLKLEQRVRARMVLVDMTATGDDNTLTTEEAKEAEDTMQQELQFRNDQIEKMKTEILDLEDMQNAVSMSDFTLDYFITQLLRYLQQNKEELESAPDGIHAVADYTNNGLFAQSSHPGAIFFFRHTNAPPNTGNPTHPFYFVHVENANGKNTIRHGFMQAVQILKLFDELAQNNSDINNRLCDAFTDSIKTPEGDEYYNALIKTAIADIDAVFNQNAAVSLTQSRDALLPTEDEIPESKNLRLITWLVLSK